MPAVTKAANRLPADGGRPARRNPDGTPAVHRFGADEFRQLLQEGTPADLADVLLAVPEADRRALASTLHSPAAGGTEQQEGALLVAGAGCLPSADAIVSWLRSRRFQHVPPAETVADLLRVLTATGRPRLSAIAAVLTDRMRPRPAWPGEWTVAAAVLAAAGTAPPRSEAVTRAWIRGHEGDPGTLADRLAADPWLDRLLPRLFQTPGLDRHWPPALAELAATGRLNRNQLIRLTLHRLAEGGTPASLRPAMTTHHLLAPTAKEITKHRRDYETLLGGPLAAFASSALHITDEPQAVPARSTKPSAKITQPAKPAAKTSRPTAGPTSRSTRPSAEAAAKTSAGSTRRPAKPPATPAARTTDPSAKDAPKSSPPAKPATRTRRSAAKRAPEIAPAPGAVAEVSPPTITAKHTQPSARPAVRAPADLAADSPTSAIPTAEHTQASANLAATKAPPPESVAEAMPVAGNRPQIGPAADSLPSPATSLAEGPSPMQPVTRPAVEGLPAPGALARIPWLAGRSAAAQTPQPGPAKSQPPQPTLPGFNAVQARSPRPVRPPVAPLFPPPPVALPPAAMPAPFGSVAELVADFADRLPQPLEAISLERILAGLVAFAQSDRDELIAAITPLADSAPPPFGLLLRALARPGHRPDRLPAEPLPPPAAMVPARIRELAYQLATNVPPALLATPATVDGQVSPVRVLFRLIAAERDNWQPGPYDLAQALLRLPTTVDTAVITAADRLVSPAGRQFATWLHAGGLPPATATITTGPHRRATVVPPPAPTIPSDAHPEPAPAGVPPLLHDPTPAATVDTIIRDLLTPPVLEAAEAIPPDMGCWTMVLPHHRDLIAAHVLPFLTGRSAATARPESSPPPASAPHTSSTARVLGAAKTASPARIAGAGPTAAAARIAGAMRAATARDEAQDHRRLADALRGLARAAGPFGPGMALALAHGLVAEEELLRDAAVDAVRHLTGSSGLDTGLLGRELRALLTAAGSAVPGDAAVRPSPPAAGYGVMSRAAADGRAPRTMEDRETRRSVGVGRLRRAAAGLERIGRGRGWHIVWALAYAVVPALLRQRPVADGLPELLAVAADAATAVGARADMPDVMLAAAEPGRSDLAVEAARLAQILTANT
ncbi:hypothetical protein [Paractinoplanes durhamensis]|nr:hypothetical protein [Actinoplanes durhamensis]